VNAARRSHYGAAMSHRSVETIIGKLVTDEGFRRRFLADASTELDALQRRGCELTPVELQALQALDPSAIQAFAGLIDRRLVKVDFSAE
jgi:hypothetical protein